MFDDLFIYNKKEIKSSIQKTTRTEKHGLSKTAVAESKIHAENNLKIKYVKQGSNIFEAYSIAEDERKDVKRQQLASSVHCLPKLLLLLPYTGD